MFETEKEGPPEFLKKVFALVEELTAIRECGYTEDLAINSLAIMRPNLVKEILQAKSYLYNEVEESMEGFMIMPNRNKNVSLQFIKLKNVIAFVDYSEFGKESELTVELEIGDDELKLDTKLAFSDIVSSTRKTKSTGDNTRTIVKNKEVDFKKILELKQQKHTEIIKENL